MKRLSLEDYAMSVAVAAAARSEDPYRRVGTCLVRPDKTIAGTGYNGAPPGVEIDWEDRDERRRWVVHAEVNALRYVKPGDVALVATTSLPCEACALIIASYAIPRVVFGDWLDPQVYDNQRTIQIFERAHVQVDQHFLVDASAVHECAIRGCIDVEVEEYKWPDEYTLVSLCATHAMAVRATMVD